MNPKEKRALNAKRTEAVKKLRYLSSEVLIAALQKDQLLHGLIEPMIRSVVAEEIDRGLSRLASQGRVPLKQISGSPARKFCLQFKTNPAAKSFTNSNLEDEHGDTICVTLIEANTGQPVTTGLESVAKLEVVPLMGDFNTEEWTAEEFERHVAKEREGKGPLLVGDLKVNLNEGVGTLGQMYFTDNSSFTRSKRFRLGVRVAQEYGILSICEGKSQSFSVIDSRGKAYMKHDTPSPTDEVWRLRNIGKDGPYHTRLKQHGIKTVRDFLSCLETRPELLKDVLSTMPERAYQDIIDHAKKCILGDKIYIYPVEQSPYESLIFDPNCQVLGAVAQGQYVGLEMVHDSEKECVDHLVKSAYDHWDTDVSECAVEDLAEPSMIALPGAVDGSQAGNIADVTAAPQEAVDGSPGAEDVPSLEPITGQDYGDGNVRGGEWTSQEQRSGYDMGSWIWLSDEEGMHPQNIASEVQNVLSEEYGEPFVLFPLDDAPSPPAVGRWWLRIRSVVRCALFIRRAGFARSL